MLPTIPNPLTLPQVFVTIGGLPDPEEFSDILEVVVDTDVFQPAMATVVFKDKVMPLTGIMKYADNMLKYRLGASLKVVVLDGILPKVTFDGEITAIEPIFDRNGNALFRIRGYDRGHRLTRGRKTRSFGGNPAAKTVTEMMVINSVISQAGLTPVVDASGISSMMYYYVMQYNQSDWDFLWSRAQMFGYQMYVEGRMLYFRPAGIPRNLLPIDPLTWGEDLTRFEPRIVSAGQVTAAKVQGWDPSLKMKIAGQGLMDLSPTSAKIGDPLPGNLATQAAFGKSEDVLVDPAVGDIAQATVVASARMAQHMSSFVRASGEVIGVLPGLTAGNTITVKGVGLRFSGAYYVTQARHIYRGGEYKITFEVTGRNPYTIRHLLLGKEKDGANSNKIDGVVTGIVTDNNDLKGLGRVKVKFPWLDDTLGSNWIRVASVGGGKSRGIFFVPEIDDEVLVAFEHGDINHPYIVGVLWNDRDKPPLTTQQAVVGRQVNKRLVRSRSGHEILLDDTAGNEQIVIKDKTGMNSITINSKDNSMVIKSQGDLTIEAGGKFTVNSKLDMAFDSKGKMSAKSIQAVEMEGQTGAKLKAGTSELDLSVAAANLKGTQVAVQANAQASVKGNAMVEIQGALVKIN